MINYKKYKLPGNATLRVRTENIVATVSSKDKNTIDLFVAGIANPFHLPVADNQEARAIMNCIWERTDTYDMEE